MTQLSSSMRRASCLFLLGFMTGGCGGTKTGSTKIPEPDTLPTVIEHEPCDVAASGGERFDTNGDGKPDIVRVKSSDRETCRVVDLNHDEKPDAYVYFDASGQVRRRESDFDRDGRVDEIAYFNAGVIVRKDRETNLDGKLDTWDFYEGGKIHHRMRDSDGDGRVDQWWTWPNPDRPECAVIAADHNRDGKPDPGDVIDSCSLNTPSPTASGGDGGAPALAASTPPAATASPASSAAAASSSAPPKAAPPSDATAKAPAAASSSVPAPSASAGVSLSGAVKAPVVEKKK